MHLVAHDLGFTHEAGAAALFEGLTLHLGPGLHWVVGDEGRGKTTLLRLLAGRLPPQRSRLERVGVDPVWFDTPDQPGDDALVARDWLARHRPPHPGWSDDREVDAIQALGLEAHIDKPLYQLSTGSRRKVGLVGAVASRAPLVLLDQPFAALDAASCHTVLDWLDAAAGAADRIWVVADYTRPAGFDAGRLIDLDARSGD